MPEASVAKTFPQWVAATMCVAVAGVVSMPFWQHLSTLGFHLASGNWEITSDNEAIEKRLALQYSADRTGVAVHRVAGSGHLLPVTEDFRANTIQHVSRVSIDEQPALRFYGTPLETTYDQFLRRLEEIVVSAPETLPRGVAEMIATARREYEAERDDMGLDFSPFSVTTKPDFDIEGDWARNSVLLEQNGRCLGKLSQLSGTESVPADIKTFPRALPVQIERPWLSDPLLDSAAHLPMPAVRQFFLSEGAADGGLRLIPQTLWVLQTDALSASVSSEGKGKLAGWVKDNACCMVTCLDRSFTVEPNTVRWKDNTAYGVLTSPKQQLFAIVSKRRGN